jgi:hypothetical protein
LTATFSPDLRRKPFLTEPLLQEKQSNRSLFQRFGIVSPLDRMRAAAIGRLSLALPKVPDLGVAGVFYKGKLFADELIPSLTGGKYFTATIESKPMPRRAGVCFDPLAMAGSGAAMMAPFG